MGLDKGLSIQLSRRVIQKRLNNYPPAHKDGRYSKNRVSGRRYTPPAKNDTHRSNFNAAK
jgi:hypothetical protein